MSTSTDLSNRSANSSHRDRGGISKRNGESSNNTTGTTSTRASSLPSVVCCDASDAYLEAMVSRVVNETLFEKKQFIILERELDVNSKLAAKALSALNMDKSRWCEVKELVRKRMRIRRNNAQSRVRERLLRKWTNYKCRA